MMTIMFSTLKNNLFCRMETEMAQFISENKIATICCLDSENRPHCFNCFYAEDLKDHLLFFKSSGDTLHSRLLLESPYIAGTILPEKTEMLSLKGIQLTGTVLYPGNSGYINGNYIYHLRFPFAKMMPGEIWCIQLSTVKMTGSRNIFRKKLKWSKPPVA